MKFEGLISSIIVGGQGVYGGVLRRRVGPAGMQMKSADETETF